MTIPAKLDSVASIPAQYSLLTAQESCANDAIMPPLPDILSLGLSLQFPENCPENYLGSLCRELQLFANLTGSHRRLQQVWFQGEGLTTLAPSGLTQLAYQVNSQFQLDDSDNSEYGIDLCHTRIVPEQLALLRGLGFRQLRIHFHSCDCLSHGDWISEVADNIELLGHYDFDDIYCRVYLGDFARQNDIKKLLLSLHLYQPQQIELTGVASSGAPSQQSRTFYLGLMKFMTQRDYLALGNHLFINRHSRLGKLYRQRNLMFTPQGFCSRQINGWLGAGLGATGYINEQHYQNTDDPKLYQQRLESGALPQTHLGALSQRRLEIEDIVQSLFCQGELEGRLVEQLPARRRFDVESVIAQATEKLWLESAGYLWRLTPCGRIHLRQLFNHLLQA